VRNRDPETSPGRRGGNPVRGKSTQHSDTSPQGEIFGSFLNGFSYQNRLHEEVKKTVKQKYLVNNEKTLLKYENG
jgi:hypothetical protein